MKRELYVTEEGSHTLYIPELKEYYHSWFGAIAESDYIYIQKGLRHCARNKNAVAILEMGLGTGLNALLTHLYAEDRKLPIHYTTLETDPLSAEEAAVLNYPQQLHATTQEQKIFENIHAGSWEQDVSLSPHMVLHKKKTSLLEVVLPAQAYDVVYFDAFAPAVQPELWSADVFRKIKHAMNPGGILVTYASRGSVKQALRDAGFELQRLPGSPRKHHMLRATSA